MPSLRAQVLARAVAIVGGVDMLATELGLPMETVARYLRGESVIPPEVFLKATEIVTAAGLAEITRSGRETEAEQTLLADAVSLNSTRKVVGD